MQLVSEGLVRELEVQAVPLKGEKARALRERVEEALTRAETDGMNPELIERLDGLLIFLTEASREVCTNIQCPHYNKKCKMR